MTNRAGAARATATDLALAQLIGMTDADTLSRVFAQVGPAGRAKVQAALDHVVDRELAEETPNGGEFARRVHQLREELRRLR